MDGFDMMYIQYAPRWKWFRPPIKWRIFRWAYKITSATKFTNCIPTKFEDKRTDIEAAEDFTINCYEKPETVTSAYNEWLGGLGEPKPDIFIPEPLLTVLPDGSVRHPVITICGSTRFKDDLIRVVGELTHAGWLVFPVGVTDSSRVIDDRKKVLLDDIHHQKIRMSDAVYVVNRDGYIGKSTASEIRYAELWMRPVYYMEGGEQNHADDNTER